MNEHTLKERLLKRRDPRKSSHKLAPEDVAALLELAAQGLPISEIADLYEIRPQTVWYHIGRACR